ncbi:MAG: SDR family NAD(P)-dependent oxidoreductase, partial [Halobacteriales archaeon]|nr:SDR family NAD(P)-dependent oxidoreductase [Halobacteriales archaeon]
TERLERQFAVNVTGPHRLARAVLPSMREVEQGRIITLSSTLAEVALPGTGAYAASKAALASLTDALRAEVAQYGIAVLQVVPGPVETQFRTRAMNEVEALPRTAAYDTVYDWLDDWNAFGGGFATTAPETVASAILNAATCTDPAPRTSVGTVARASQYVRYLPTGIRDWLVRVLMRLA